MVQSDFLWWQRLHISLDMMKCIGSQCLTLWKVEFDNRTIREVTGTGGNSTLTRTISSHFCSLLVWFFMLPWPTLFPSPWWPVSSFQVARHMAAEFCIISQYGLREQTFYLYSRTFCQLVEIGHGGSVYIPEFSRGYRLGLAIFWVDGLVFRKWRRKD